MPKYFTVEEANIALATIRPLMNEIMQLRQEILAKQPVAWPAVEKAAGNGGSKIASSIAMEFSRLDALVRKILETGAEIKDLNTGLVDFRSFREEREIYLCWKYGEEQLSYWHDLDAGFAGRQLL